MADPSTILKAENIDLDLRGDVSVKALENTDTVFHLVIPVKPTKLSDEELEAIAGGGSNRFLVTGCRCHGTRLCGY